MAARPGSALAESDIQLASSSGAVRDARATLSQRREPDAVRILSGVFEGQDHRHPDRTGHRERGTRASATTRPCAIVFARATRTTRISRNTACAIIAAAGALPRSVDRHARRGRRDPHASICAAARAGSRFRRYLAQLGPLVLVPVAIDQSHYDNPFFCPDPTRVTELETFMDAPTQIRRLRRCAPSRWLRAACRRTRRARLRQARRGHRARDDGDQRREGRRNRVLASRVSRSVAAEHRDPLTPTGFTSNNAGGVLGGISTGQGRRRQHRPQADVEPAPAGRQHRSRGPPGRGGHYRTSRSLRRPARDPDRRGHARAGVDGPLPAPAGAEWRRSAARPRSSPAGCDSCGIFM